MIEIEILLTFVYFLECTVVIGLRPKLGNTYYHIMPANLIPMLEMPRKKI
jgi:hypothetical protein